MRDRLVKLIDDFCRNNYVEKYIPTQEAYEFFIAATAFADYLLANGVIVPPCKVGDKVFLVGHISDAIPDFIYDDTITKIGVTTRGVMHERGIDFADFGKTVFLTRAEAERALKGDKDINVLCKTEKGR